MSEQDPTIPEIDAPEQIVESGIWAREVSLAAGLVVLLLGSMWVSTGSFPPMVVVESRSMMHEEGGSLGAIDPGDLIMVMSNDRKDVITYVEATNEADENFGYESHGWPGDVIIYRKNGGSDTPVIHRALLEVVANGSGWDVPGTSLVNVQEITLTLDYDCYNFHDGNYKLNLQSWEPEHAGFLTSGDNNNGGCMIDQPSANSHGVGIGLHDSMGNPVLPVKDDWVVGVASSEIPWVGSIKLLTTGTAGSVTPESWGSLSIAILLVLAAPFVMDYLPATKKGPDEEE